jgi:hypothetical protein
MPVYLVLDAKNPEEAMHNLDDWSASPIDSEDACEVISVAHAITVAKLDAYWIEKDVEKAICETCGGEFKIYCFHGPFAIGYTHGKDHVCWEYIR